MGRRGLGPRDCQLATAIWERSGASVSRDGDARRRLARRLRHRRDKYSSGKSLDVRRGERRRERERQSRNHEVRPTLFPFRSRSSVSLFEQPQIVLPPPPPPSKFASRILIKDGSGAHGTGNSANLSTESGLGDICYPFGGALLIQIFLPLQSKLRT